MGGAGVSRPSPSSDAGQPSEESAKSETAQKEINIEPDDEALDQLEKELHPPPTTILRLARRTSDLLLVKPSGAKCQDVVKYLKDTGFTRVTQCDHLDSHVVQTTQNTDVTLVALEIGGDPEDAVNSFRHIQEQLKTRKKTNPVVLSDQFEPILLELAEELSLPVGFTCDHNWAETLDKAIGLLRRE
jgi:hypothetical protein